MFSLTKFSAAALALAATARADLFITSFNIQINGTSEVHWVSTDLDADPSLITVQLGNPTFHNTYAIGTSIPTTQGSLNLMTPSLLPGDGYTVQLVKIDDVNTIYAETNTFALIDSTPVKESSISAGAPSTTAASTSSKASSISTPAAVTTGASTPAAGSTTGAAPVVASNTPAATNPASTSNTAQIPGTSAGSSSNTSNNNNNNNSAAVGLVPAGAVAAVVAGAVALFF